MCKLKLLLKGLECYKDAQAVVSGTTMLEAACKLLGYRTRLD